MVICLNKNTKADSVLCFITDLGVLEKNLIDYLGLFLALT